MGIQTLNMRKGTNYASAVDFTNTSATWNTTGTDRYALDAHFGAETTYDYYKLVHNRNSIDNKGFAIKSYVHYSSNYVNAFWDGSRMTYGDGSGATTALTAMDAATSTGDPLHVSAISLVEVLYLVEKGRLPASDRQLLLEALDDPEQPPRLVPVDRQVLNALENVPRQDVPDMPDRIIAATALAMGFPLISRDGKIRASQVIPFGRVMDDSSGSLPSINRAWPGRTGF